jgi:uncharacterized protein (DUF58 family)
VKLTYQFNEWLETHLVSPSYSAWVLAGISLCFFGAATNTMAGWLYAISGIVLALLILGFILPRRSLAKLKIYRRPIAPVNAGEELTIELEIKNPTSHPKTLLQIADYLPPVLAQPMNAPVEAISPHNIYRWTYYLPTKRRGIYQWDKVGLRTGMPLGVCWCRRTEQVPAKAIVYPTILPLTNCPLIETIGQENNNILQSQRRNQSATEGLTKTLRPYRHGDPLRLIHWRSSARWGEFKVRELEIITGNQEIIICLDTASKWEEDYFEQAVIAAASLYFYATQRQLNVKLWTGTTGLLHGNRVVLETLAGIRAGEKITMAPIPSLASIWLSSDPLSLNSLPLGSRWVLFSGFATAKVSSSVNSEYPGLTIDLEQPLEKQLQRNLSNFS